MNMKIVKMQPDLSVLIDLIKEKHKKIEASVIDVFIEKYFESVTHHEFTEKSIEEVYGATLSSWEFMQKRQQNRIKIEVFNPDLAKDGWQSTHTVIQILAPDMPFLIDTVRMEINRRHMSVHTAQASTICTIRSEVGKLDKQAFMNSHIENGVNEALLYLEIDKHSDNEILQDIQNKLFSVLSELSYCVEDYPKFIKAIDDISEELKQLPYERPEEDVDESLQFLHWLSSGHFTFLAYDEFSIVNESDIAYVIRHKDKNLGTFRYIQTDSNKKKIIELPAEIQTFMLSDTMINFFKSGSKSRIHRPAYSDYVVVKRFNEKGEVIGGVRFMGLYTSTVYLETPMHFPIVRQKIEKVWEMADIDPRCYSGKELNRILEIFPRDELIQSTEEQLFNTTIGILSMKERRQTRMFIRKDTYGKFISCLCFSPRDSFNTELRVKMQNVLSEAWHAIDAEFDVLFSESILTRVYFVLRLDPSSPVDVDIKAVERKIQQVTRSWVEDLQEALINDVGEEKGNALFFKYRTAFPVAYREDFSAHTATMDIQTIEGLKSSSNQDISMSVSQEEAANHDSDQLNFKLFTTIGFLPLSDLLPVLENFGLRVIGEHPYRVELLGGEKVCIHSFSIVYTLAERVDMQAVKSLFQQAFRQIWEGIAENDSFNKLVLGAGIDWRDIAMLRAYARYMKQTLFGIGEQYIADTLVRYISMSKLLIQAFKARFGVYPDWTEKHRNNVFNEVEREFLVSLDHVEQLNEDRVFRCYLELIKATLRTNFFRLNDAGDPKNYLSLKLNCHAISYLPQPVPMFEIFVYSACVEGVHLRGGKVARGGLRWSDRNEDFRTEVLGLVKAQQVKNAIIVPVGAKGGFIAKKVTPGMTRDETLKEGIESYKTFINALIDVTDNLVDAEVVPPTQVVRHDDDDVYLVVAADKGTATFSDISNAIAIERGFWLGDAFASGGSIGYDHKKMGITAKGAWISVQRHFREKGLNIQKENFTVVGIGDMSGDVFGNGMLLSPCIELTAAFNHQHIFIDPMSDASASYAERQRLFNLPRSSWADYDSALISEGGGVFLRTAKSIAMTNAMKARFKISKNQLTPTEFIKALLKAPVDLIWNGGIGTYIKSSYETHAEVGDKANDGLRINAKEISASVVGEGGNLGLTQLARVEFSLLGGACYTDFIDNAAGVDCSDHEVNIKIMLNDLIQSQQLSFEERNRFFLEMTQAVSSLVLKNNYYQTQAMTFASKESSELLDDYLGFIRDFSEAGKLDRALEFLPDEDVVRERMVDGVGFTKPELSVLISYAKSDLKEQLNCDEISQDTYLIRFLEKAFPLQLVQSYPEQLSEHKLRREIIATQLANDMVNFMGIVFVSRLMHSHSGKTVFDVAKAYVIAREVFDLENTMEAICALDYNVSTLTQEQMIYFMVRLIRRASRWILINRRADLDVASEVAFFKAGVDTVKTNLPIFLKGNSKEAMKARFENYTRQGVDEQLAGFIASSGVMISTLGIVDVAHQTSYQVEKVAEAYFALSEMLSLDWVSEQINNLPICSHWQELARITYRADLERILRSLTKSVLLNVGSENDSVSDKLSHWLSDCSYVVSKWQDLLDEIKPYEQLEYPMFSVALTELQQISQLFKADA